MAISNTEVLIFVMFIVLGSIITVMIYRRIVRGITTRKEERSATRVGRIYGTASEKIVKRSK